MGFVSSFGRCLALALLQLSSLQAHREHKVHNIVLYPDKQSWCKTTPIKQVVTWPQCSSQELDNNVCVGACFSYMVPHSEPSAPGDLIRPYCDSCQPFDSVWHTVTLDCKDKDGNPTSMQKKVQIIRNCSCTSCIESSRIKPDISNLLQTLELEAKLESISEKSPLESSSETVESESPGEDLHETPDLLLDPNLNASSKATALPPGKATERLEQLFKQLADSNAGPERLAALKKLGQIGGLGGLTLAEHPGAEALLSRLNQLIHKYADLEKEEKLLNNQEIGGDGDSGSLESSQLPPATPEEPQVPSLQDEQDRVAASLLHRHHHGPHHSMVLDAGDVIKEKLDVESHHLQPAVPGQEISYHDKPKEKDF